MADPPLRVRNKEIRKVKVKSLQEAPWNFRKHGSDQRSAFEGTVDEIGWYGYPDVFETADGTLMICDGHLRKSFLLEHYGKNATIEVNVTDFNEEDAKKATLTHDPLAAMAEADEQILGELMAGLDIDNESLESMLAGLADEHGIDLFEPDLPSDLIDPKYSRKITSPVYEPSGPKPPLSALIDRRKTKAIIKQVIESELDDRTKKFLRLAAERHTVFDFRQIAEFYCHSDEATQDLMEQSGLVIIDFDKAIQHGFVHLTERLGEIADLGDLNGNA